MTKDPNIIFDNIIFDLQKAGGISKFWAELVTYFSARKNVCFIDNGETSNVNRGKLKIAQEKSIKNAIPVKIGRYMNFNKNYFDEIHIFHSSYYRINKHPSSINVVTVHDLIYEKFETGPAKFVHILQKKVALKNADHIVCVSENTRKDLLEYYPFCKTKEITVIPNGVGEFIPNYKTESSSTINAAIKKPYFLYVGHRGSCKGFPLIFDALRFFDKTMNCVVVGKPFTDVEMESIKKLGLQENIINVGNVSFSELNQLYSNATFFFFPSYYEGFGIPPLEAMMSGCAVVASNLSSVPEVVGDAGVLFDPYSLDSLKVALEKISDPAVRSLLIKSGFKQIEKFSWGSIFEKYSVLYSQLLKVKKEASF